MYSRFRKINIIADYLQFQLLQTFLQNLLITYSDLLLLPLNSISYSAACLSHSEIKTDIPERLGDSKVGSSALEIPRYIDDAYDNPHIQNEAHILPTKEHI